MYTVIEKKYIMPVLTEGIFWREYDDADVFTSMRLRKQFPN